MLYGDLFSPNIPQMDYLLWSTGKAVLKLVQYADHKVEDGTMKKSRLIVPGQRRTRKWILSLLNHGDSTTEHAPDSAESGSAIITSGSSFGDAKDPEHLVPATAWQRGSNYFRRFGRSLGSIESAHGFRVACATMSIAIVAYLEDTREFFLEQRIVWAMVMVAIGMTVTAGSGVFGFIGRIAGTCEPHLTLIGWQNLSRDSHCYVYQLDYLVYCERSSCWGHCFRFRLCFLPDLLSPEVSTIPHNRSTINSDTRYALSSPTDND